MAKDGGAPHGILTTRATMAMKVGGGSKAQILDGNIAWIVWSRLVAEQATSKTKESRRRRRSASSESSSSVSSAVRRKDRKAKKKDKKNRRGQRGEPAAASTGLRDSERQGLQEFRRRAEIDKIREEVKAGLTARPRGGGADVKPGTLLLPKTARIVVVETRLLCADGSAKQLLTSVRGTRFQGSFRRNRSLKSKSCSNNFLAMQKPNTKEPGRNCALLHGRVAETV